VSGEHRASSPRKQSRPGDGCSRASETEIGHEPAQREHEAAAEGQSARRRARNGSQQRRTQPSGRRAQGSASERARRQSTQSERLQSQRHEQTAGRASTAQTRRTTVQQRRQRADDTKLPAQAQQTPTHTARASPRTAAERDRRKPAARARHSKAARAVAAQPSGESETERGLLTQSETEQSQMPRRQPAGHQPTTEGRRRTERDSEQNWLDDEDASDSTQCHDESEWRELTWQTAAGSQQHSRPGDGCARHRRPAEPVPSRSSPQCDGGSGGGRSRHSLRHRKTAPQPRNLWATVESVGPPSRIKRTPRLRLEEQGAGGLGRVASCWVQG